MRKYNNIIVWLVVLIVFYFAYKDKSYVRMKNQARRELIDMALDSKPEWVLDSLKGPIIKEERKDYLTFTWFDKVAYNDTAIVSIDVNKSNFVWFGTRNGSNYQIEYWDGPKANVNDLFPSGYAVNSIHSRKSIDSFRIAGQQVL